MGHTIGSSSWPSFPALEDLVKLRARRLLLPPARSRKLHNHTSMNMPAMIKPITASALIALAASSSGQVCQLSMQTWGGSSLDYADRVVRIDAQGNRLLFGYTESSGAGGVDLLLLEINSAGVIQWARTWGSAADEDDFDGLAVDAAGAFYISGRTQSFGAIGGEDAVLLSYNAAGQLQDAQAWDGGGGQESFDGVAIDPVSGNVYCVGSIDSGSLGDALIVTFNAAGAFQGAVTWGDSNHDEQLNGCTFDSTAGRLYASGQVDGDGLVLCYDPSNKVFDWAYGYQQQGAYSQFYDIAVESGPGLIYCNGVSQVTASTSQKVLLTQWTVGGTINWASVWGSNEQASYVVIDPMSSDALLDISRSNSKAGILRFRSDGSLVWARTWAGVGLGQIAFHNGKILVPGATSSCCIQIEHSNEQATLIPPVQVQRYVPAGGKRTLGGMSRPISKSEKDATGGPCMGGMGAGDVMLLELTPCSTAGYPISYCTAKVNSCGTKPSIGSNGCPSAAQPNGFMVQATNTKALKAGLLIYTDSGRGNAPFSGGTLCLNTPVKRSIAVLDTSGTPSQCNGTLSLDMNCFAAGICGGNPAAYLSVPGTVVNCQFWGRDTVANGALLSDALEYFVGS